MFSELSGITAETGLGFSDEHTALYGEKSGFGVTVTDADDRYSVAVFCKKPYERSSDIAAMIADLGGGLPKNAIISQSCETGSVLVALDKYSLLQEDVVYLIEFLDKLTDGLSSLGLEGAQYRFPSVKKPSLPKPEKNEVRVKLSFDIHSVYGLIGAVIGAAAMVVIAVLLVNADFEIDTFGLSFEISTYIISAASAAVIFADYRFLARKLDACGVIACPVLAIGSVIPAGLGAGVKACAHRFSVSFMDALRGFPEYLGREEAIGSFIAGYITRGLVIAVVACVVIYIFYFNRHPDETVRSEKIVHIDENGIEKRPDKR